MSKIEIKRREKNEKQGRRISDQLKEQERKNKRGRTREE